MPSLFTIMVRASGAAAYVAASRCALEAAPARGEAINLTLEGRTIRGVVDELFIPPGCEEHCVGTVFVSEG
jgi:hypothetical protein